MKKSIALLFCLCVSLAVFCPTLVNATATVDDTNCLTCHDVGSPGTAGETVHGKHTAQACTICHAATGDTPATSKCIVCHPVGNVGACPLVNNHEAAGADCLSCHSACQAQAEVAIEPATVTLNPGDTQTFTATTTGGDNTPAYTWEVQGGTAGTGNTTTGDSIEYTAGNTPGDYTITVTDTANGNIQATAAVKIEAEVTCTVTVKDEEVLKSHWVARPALIQIQTTGIEVSQATGVAFASNAPGGALKSIIPLVKLVNADAGIIYQLAIISPAIFTGNFDAESETITVAVEGCTQTDTFDLKLLYLGPIPLSK